MQRREVAEPQDGRGGGRSRSLDRRRRVGAPGVVGDVEQRGERREPDQLRLGELDAVLGGELADASPRPARAASSRSRAGSSRPAPRSRGSSIRNPLAWTRGRPPPDSRTRRAIRLASSTSSRLEVDVVGDEERPSADGDRAGRRVHPGRPEVGLAAVLVDLRLEALVLAAPDVGELDPVGPRARPGRRGRPAGRSGRRSARRTRGRARRSRPSSCRRAGTNGMTSTAPIRGCSPVCASMSMSSIAGRDEPLEGLASRRSCSPAIVNTERLWLASLVRSSRRTPGTDAIRRRPAGRRRRGGGPRRRSGRTRPAPDDARAPGDVADDDAGERRRIASA